MSNVRSQSPPAVLTPALLITRSILPNVSFVFRNASINKRITETFKSSTRKVELNMCSLNKLKENYYEVNTNSGGDVVGYSLVGGMTSEF